MEIKRQSILRSRTAVATGTGTDTDGTDDIDTDNGSRNEEVRAARKTSESMRCDAKWTSAPSMLARRSECNRRMKIKLCFDRLRFRPIDSIRSDSTRLGSIRLIFDTSDHRHQCDRHTEANRSRRDRKREERVCVHERKREQ